MISPEGKLTSITRDAAGRPNALRYPDGQVLDVAYKTDPTKQIDTVTPRYTVADGFDGPTAAADSNKWTVTNTSGGSQAKNEFADNGHFPFQLYVREARRLVGEYTLTEHDITGDGRDRTPRRHAA